MKRFLFTLLLLFISIIFSCTGADDLPQDYSGSCDKPVVIDKEMYELTSSKNYQITGASISGDCLEVEIYSGGCDGSTWQVDLYDRNAMAESYPMQRYIKISLENSELCNAFVLKTFTFDLSRLRFKDSPILLNLEGWEDGLLYEY